MSIETKPEWKAAATDMLQSWDKWFEGRAGGNDDEAKMLSLASAFAAQAFDDAASSGITADGAPAALLRAFLLGIINPLHPDLDHLRSDPDSAEAARAARDAPYMTDLMLDPKSIDDFLAENPLPDGEIMKNGDA
jgi:hypothetical protein